MTVVNTVLVGYLDADYLTTPYGSGYIGGNTGWQVNGVISGNETPIGGQSESVILDELPIGMQADGVILDFPSRGFQAESNIVNYPNPLGWQVESNISGYLKPQGWEAVSGKLHHVRCPELGYLAQGYLEYSYLSGGYCAVSGWQIIGGLNTEYSQGWQVQGIIGGTTTKGMQTLLRIIENLHPIGFEVNTLQAKSLGWQVTSVLYNATNLRILCDFPSRGLTSSNWTATSTETGDFNVNNVDTDIVEQIWRSQTGITTATISCDTGLPQGVFLDTFAALNHNLTTSASVTLEGSTDSGFSSVGISINITPTQENMYYIAPILPLTGYRYWRLVIDDPTNTDSYLSIGTVLFGAATIFHEECFVDNPRRKQTHYKDEVFVEGHTNIMNDRGIKKSISLEFRNIKYAGGNFQNLLEIFNTSRTHLKCLWIPVPTVPERFAIFGKLVQIPEEQHNYKTATNDHVDFTIEVDESK